MTPASYSVHPTALGDAALLYIDAKLAALEVVHERLEDVVEDWAMRCREVPDFEPGDPLGLHEQLDAYFDGDLREFDVALDWRLTSGFTSSALQAVCTIPYGETASYGEVAAMAGSPRAHRAVGTACRVTPFSLVVPVHRVIRSDGSLGEFGAHPEDKVFLHDHERLYRSR